MTADPAEWLRTPVASRERPSPAQAAADRVLGQLRHVDGLDLDALRSDLGARIEGRALDVLVAGGLLSRRGRAVALTDDGFAVADAVTRHLVQAIRIP
jgi:hypothetical protein